MSIRLYSTLHPPSTVPDQSVFDAVQYMDHIVHIVIFGIYCIVTFVSFLNKMQMAKRTKYILEEKLGISVRKLMNGAVDWDRDIVQKLMALQESGQYCIVISNGTPIQCQCQQHAYRYSHSC